MLYKTKEEAIEAAKLSLEAETADEFELEESQTMSGHTDTAECWCEPEKIEVENGIIYVHRSTQ